MNETERNMVKLCLPKKRRRRYYATVIRLTDADWRMELVIGARNKKTVCEAFKKLAPDWTPDPKKIYYVEARVVKR